MLDDKENPNCQHILWRKLIRYNEAFGYQYKVRVKLFIKFCPFIYKKINKFWDGSKELAWMLRTFEIKLLVPLWNNIKRNFPMIASIRKLQDRILIFIITYFRPSIKIRNSGIWLLFFVDHAIFFYEKDKNSMLNLINCKLIISSNGKQK